MKTEANQAREKYSVLIEYSPGNGFQFSAGTQGAMSHCPDTFVSLLHAANCAEREVRHAGFLTSTEKQP